MAAVRLRPITPEDADRCFAWSSDPDVARYLGLLHPPLSVEQERTWILSVRADSARQRHFIIEDEHGRPIGTCGLRGIDPEEGTAHLGLLIGYPTEWGQGYGAAATEALLEYGFRELGLKEIRLSYHRDNQRAARLYRRLGFLPSRHKLPQWTFGRAELRMALTRDRWQHLRAQGSSPAAP